MNFLIFEDHSLTALGIEVMISQVLPDAKTQSVSSFSEGLSKLTAEHFDYIILDIDIPEGEGIRMISKIKEIQNHVKILIHSGYDEKIYALSYISAGADGFISKQTSREEFKSAIATLHADKKYMSPDIQQVMLNSMINNAPLDSDSLFLNLSQREMEVMKLVGEGKFTNEIADIMNLKASTISTYKNRLYAKLNVTNEIELSKKIALFKY
ncbi:response regulator transcription factor [Dyadobacter sp. CY345]|uniref:response regulator n=1 Tax=Dyadobacter sp. CY345 TaxID=2909335 RepID=UPI001F21260C|nr:response regulator transcription factor [Dyadobacter sp. CY345]MCF2447671.1 response regulator transcription factor [Dyadobacter sp. CY345]